MPVHSPGGNPSIDVSGLSATSAVILVAPVFVIDEPDNTAKVAVLPASDTFAYATVCAGITLPFNGDGSLSLQPNNSKVAAIAPIIERLISYIISYLPSATAEIRHDFYNKRSYKLS